MSPNCVNLYSRTPSISVFKHITCLCNICLVNILFNKFRRIIVKCIKSNFERNRWITLLAVLLQQVAVAALAMLAAGTVLVHELEKPYIYITTTPEGHQH